MSETPSTPAGVDRGQLRTQLRTEMRARRKKVTAREQAAAAQGLAGVVIRHRVLRPGMRIAIYQARGREADLSRIITIETRRLILIPDA